jgi:glycosyltransferase involved in cell wall biosynthesis
MKSPGRILIIPSWYPPDGGYFFKEHSEAMQRTGWQVDVLVNRVVGIRKILQQGRSALGGYRVGKENGLRVIRSVYLKIPGSEEKNIQKWAAGTARLYKRYEKEFGKPDLILTHSVTWAGFAASLINKLYGIPYVVVEHRSFFVWSTEKARNMVKPYYLPFFEEAYRNCSRLVLVSESLLTGLKELLPWIEEKTLTIPNMIREDMFMPPSVVRNRDPFVFLWAGRLEHVKGVDLLIEAAQILKERGTNNFFIRLAGKGSLQNELEKQAREAGVSDVFTFLGRISREEMQKEMQMAACFVLPTRYEAFGAVLIEAMATGLPVIATRSGGPDALVNNDNGILIDTENAEQLAGAMEDMMHRINEFSEQKIRKQTMERYGQHSVMKQYNELFMHLVPE